MASQHITVDLAPATADALLGSPYFHAGFRAFADPEIAARYRLEPTPPLRPGHTVHWPIRPARVETLRRTARTAELAVTIHEGKNRQIRRMCAACGLTVKRLCRVREHTLELGDLPAGAWRYLTPDEVLALKEA